MNSPTLADLSPALKTLRQAIIAFLDRGVIPARDIPDLCMHVAQLDREGKPPGAEWMHRLAELLPGAFMLAAEGLGLPSYRSHPPRRA